MAQLLGDSGRVSRGTLPGILISSREALLSVGIDLKNEPAS